MPKFKKLMIAMLSLVLVLSLVVLPGCGGKKQQPGSQAGSGQGKAPSQGSGTPTTEERTPLNELDGRGLVIGAYVTNLSNPFFAELNEGLQAMAKQLGATVKVGASASGVDQADLVRNMENWIQQGVDAIITAPVDPEGSNVVINKAVQKGIPVITVADDAPNSKRSVYIAADQYKGGQLQAEWIGRVLGGQGKIAIIEGEPANESNEKRKRGFNDVIKNYPNIQVVQTLAGYWDRSKGLKNAEDIITAHPDIDAIVCMNDEMALGAVQAAKHAGKLGKIKIIGFNGADNALQSIAKGELDGTLLTLPYVYGQLSLEWAVRMAKGEKPPANAQIDAGCIFVDKLFVSKILNANKKIK